MKLFARIFDPYFSIIFVMTYKYRQTASTQHYLSRPVSEGTKGVKRRKWDAGMCEGKARSPPVSIDLSLVAWTVLDALHFKLLLDVVGDTTLHGDCIHPTHIFI